MSFFLIRVSSKRLCLEYLKIGARGAKVNGLGSKVLPSRASGKAVALWSTSSASIFLDFNRIFNWSGQIRFT